MGILKVVGGVVDIPRTKNADGSRSAVSGAERIDFSPAEKFTRRALNLCDWCGADHGGVSKVPHWADHWTHKPPPVVCVPCWASDCRGGR